MNENNEANINQEFEDNSSVETQKIISLDKFIILSIISFGIYEIWWMYKAWRFFKQKNGLDISSVIRALLSIFFLYFLNERILSYAKDEGYSDDYSPGILFVGFILTNLMSRLPDPYWVVSSLSFLFLIPPFIALNYAKQHSDEFPVEIEKSYNGKQIFLIIFCSICWLIVLVQMISGKKISEY